MFIAIISICSHVKENIGSLLNPELKSLVLKTSNYHIILTKHFIPSMLNVRQSLQLSDPSPVGLAPSLGSGDMLICHYLLMLFLLSLLTPQPEPGSFPVKRSSFSPPSPHAHRGSCDHRKGGLSMIAGPLPYNIKSLEKSKRTPLYLLRMQFITINDSLSFGLQRFFFFLF